MALSIRALGPRCESPKDAALTIATQHLSRSLRLISERFSGASRVTDANIAVVVVMSEVERMNGQIETGKIHLDGLEKMIQLRKGIRKLQPALVEKILRYASSSQIEHRQPADDLQRRFIFCIPSRRQAKDQRRRCPQFR